MKLRQLRFFIKVVETGNITRAAEQLNVAQTALGLQIRNLEEGLKVPLLERHSRGVRPTEAGALLYDRAVALLGQIEDIQREITTKCGGRTTIRFGTTPSTLKLVGSDLIVIARQTMPTVDLHMVEELSFLLVDTLMRGELDYILAYGVPDLPGIRRLPILHEDLLHISAHGHGAKHGLGDTVSLQHALTGELALVNERDVIWQIVHEAAERLSLEVNPAYRVQSMQGIKTLIQRDIAQSIMPYGIVAEQIQSGELEARRLVRPPLGVTLYLAYAEQKHAPRDVANFKGFIDQIMAILMRTGPFVHPVE